jgi:hypothetical protein
MAIHVVALTLLSMLAVCVPMCHGDAVIIPKRLS